MPFPIGGPLERSL